MTNDTDTLPIANKSTSWKLYFNIGLVIVLLGIFAWQVKKNWAGITTYPWHGLRWDLALLALAVLLLCLLLDIIIFNRSLCWFSKPLKFIQATPVFIWSNMARYIPGKVASLVVRAALATDMGCRPVPVLAASALELLLRTSSALLIFVTLLPTWGTIGQTDRATGRFFISAIIFIVVALVCAHPKITVPVLNWGLRKFKQPPLEHTLRYREILGLVSLEIFRWTLMGVSTWLLACAIVPRESLQFAYDALWPMIGMHNAAWAAGFLSMAPGGVGIAEGVQALVLSKVLGFPHVVALIVPISVRLWSLAAEGLWSLIALFMYRKALHTAPVKEPV